MSKLKREKLITLLPQLKNSEKWFAEEGHIENSETNEIVIFINLSWINGEKPRLAIEDLKTGKWLDKKIFANYYSEIELEEKKLESVKKVIRYRYSGIRNRVEKVNIFLFSFPSLETEEKIRVRLELPDSYPRPPWECLSEKFESEQESSIKNIPSGEKRLSFVFDSEFIEKADPANANRVAGLEKEKEHLKRFLSSSIQEKWGLPEERGIILEGSPGTGKTELVMEVCQEEFGEIPIVISGPEILSKWLGESEKILRQKFHEAWEREKGRVVYIDELDAIARAREEVSESYSAQIVAQLLVLLDGVEAKQQAREKPFKVIASTNLGHIVDPALRRPGRLGARPIRFSLPDRKNRKAILHYYLEKIYQKNPKKLQPELQDFVEKGEEKLLSNLLDETIDFSGADIEDLVGTAVSKLSSESSKLTIEELERSLNEFEKNSFGVSSDIIDLDKESDPKIENLIKNLLSEHCVFRLPEGKYQDKEIKKIARTYFKHSINKSREEEKKTYRLRKVKLSNILRTDWIQTKENIVQAFQHSKEEQICLFFLDFEDLRKTRKDSEVLNRIWGIIHEQFLGWDANNLLIIVCSKELGLPGEVSLA